MRALHDRQIAHAFLDVVGQEPLPPESPLWSTPHLALMPHASAISVEYLDLWFEELASELREAGADQLPNSANRRS